MRIIPISQQECSEFLQRVSIGRLACSLNDQPYVVPVAFSYEPDCIYIFSTFGKKIEWMRKNPKVCLQADEIGNRSNWTSVVVTGTYLELSVPQYHTSQREHARKQLAEQCSEWWRIPLSGARDRAAGFFDGDCVFSHRHQVDERTSCDPGSGGAGYSGNGSIRGFGLRLAVCQNLALFRLERHDWASLSSWPRHRLEAVPSSTRTACSSRVPLKQLPQRVVAVLKQNTGR